MPSDGGGQVDAVLSGDTLKVSGAFREMIGAFDPTIMGGAHLHLGLPGENGGIAITLNTRPDEDLSGGVFLESENTFVLESAQIDALRNRGMYVNIHTTSYPNGELRGQLLPAADAYYFANLLGSNEVPSIMTQGGGALALELHGDSMVVTGSFSGLESDFAVDIGGGAHLHTAMAGANGDVDIVLNAQVDNDQRGGVFLPADNTFPVSEAQKARLSRRGYYANLHSVQFPGGELRGQVVGMSQTLFRAHLSGMNEVPVVVSAGNGQIIGELDADTLIVSGRFDDLESPVATSIAGGLHLHVGKAGQNGGIAIELDAVIDSDSLGGTLMPADNRYVLNADQRELLTTRSVYLNIHSQAHPNGEIRGQMLPEAKIVLHGNLSGIFEVPDYATRAYGAVKAELSDDRLFVSGSFDNLSAPVDTNIEGGAHLHSGAAGATGGIEVVLTPTLTGEQRSGEFEAQRNRIDGLDSAQLQMLRDRNIYLNIHSTNAPSGELRAQMVGEANYYFTAPLSGASEVPQPVNTAGRGMVVLEITGETAIAHGAFYDLSSPVDTSILGGAHIHAGQAGQGGPVVKILQPTIDEDGRGGFFSAADNVISMSPGQLDTLRDRGYYVNIHSLNVGTGEIRGQALPVATAYFTTTLAGIHEVQPISTEASGALKLELNGNDLTVSGSFAGLESDFATDIGGGAHLHLGGPAVNGGVDLLLNTDLSEDNRAGLYHPENNTNSLDDLQLMSLFNGMYYANIHSIDQPGGEIRGQILPEINFFPTDPPAILEPAPGVILPLEGPLSDLFTVRWEVLSEDQNDLVYIWQVATSPDFDTIAFQTNTGTETELSLTFGALDTLLAGLGVEPGATAQVYHRVVVSDGANEAAGPTLEANFVRSLSTSVDNLLVDDHAFEVYPTVTQGQIQLRAELSKNADMSLDVLNGLGEPVEQTRNLGNRQNLQETLDLGRHPAGMYFLQLRLNGRPVATRRIMLR